MSKKLNAQRQSLVKNVLPPEPDRKGHIGEAIWELKNDKRVDRYNLLKNGEMVYSGFSNMCLAKAVQLGVEWE